MSGIFLLLGSNLGDKVEIMKRASRFIEEQVGSILKSSELYETEAWGYHNQPNFVNQVVEIETPLDAENVLEKILSIEKELGRVRFERWKERTIDIDILYYQDQVIQLEYLTVPHPEIQNRRFVLIPMNEIAPEFTHPLLHQSQQKLLAACTDSLTVTKIEAQEKGDQK